MARDRDEDPIHPIERVICTLPDQFQDADLSQLLEKFRSLYCFCLSQIDTISQVQIDNYEPEGIQHSNSI